MKYSRYFSLILVLFVLVSFKMPFASKNKLVINKVDKQGWVSTSYGLIDNYSIVVKNTVKPNEFVSNALEKYTINYSTALAITSYNDSIFDAKKFKVGNPYTVVFKEAKGELTANQFIYEKNKIDYALFNIEDENSISGALKSKPIITKKSFASAIVKNSLYQTLIDIDANPLLAVELAEVYKWTIDFYRVQENDYFKVIYYEQFVEGESIGEFDIEACVFSHLGIENKAFAYSRTNQEQVEYFDEDGNTLKEFFLQAPVAYSRISSPYTMNRFHPVTGVNKPHLGTDYAAPTGTPIYSTANGVITHAKYSKYNGNYVKIKHNNTYTTQYLHMSKIASGIKPGVSVEQGQTIGYVGSTGLATGPHVCYRFWKNGKQVDPYAEDIPKADPLTEEELPAYFNYIQKLDKKLTNLIIKT